MPRCGSCGLKNVPAYAHSYEECLVEQVSALQARVKELEERQMHEGQHTCNNVKIVDALRAENAKLRKVVDAAREAAKDVSASRGHNPDEECCSLCDLAKAIGELGDEKWPEDATEYQKKLRSEW